LWAADARAFHLRASASEITDKAISKIQFDDLRVIENGCIATIQDSPQKISPFQKWRDRRAIVVTATNCDQSTEHIEWPAPVNEVDLLRVRFGYFAKPPHHSRSVGYCGR
jgi:hypothetical protein